ncbi:DUF1156 domain-containing protein [Mesorhizobium sp. M1E.F.Ca.ET.045.02.1.1]|uniref:anti-phage-associated DUF1156 domain-containing protein n=1 Tax=Mesorhizobium sp. M1E.F.Ca.ET.045.02.1.1 TaxID=2493672 RepID=UPI000F7604AB|nr:anti-phage-associated DUF1156 domain-containing protein [Mesorhizobium sp. M1E.F.Ca.ET.045.02.1.1]AZO22687.1 DUF1156 domain-containing protein [Mesorhizobium sp. M1E.F.Ca.ET.045.02.1.1]
MNTMTLIPPKVAPLSLADAPSFIERELPVGRISAEAYKERKAGAGQTLTALGSYWKGRKPLILVRATVLGCLLPATNDPMKDLRIFLMLMGMDDAAIARRIKSISPRDIDSDWSSYLKLVEPGDRPIWRKTLTKEDRHRLIAEWLATLPYDDRLAFCFRPEECNEDELLGGIWDEVNAHLKTSARSFPELIEQLGIMRFGHRPKVADTFCGGGSIPFEAARMGCDVYASDLNPIACMLTWGAFNFIGASKEKRAEVDAEQKRVAQAVDAEITRLGVEHDAHGNRAKAYLYCLETRCPKTGWMVPMAPSWVISKTRSVVARLVPDHDRRCYEIVIETGVDEGAMKVAAQGTVQGGRLVHPMNPEKDGVAISVIRGDRREGRINKNGLRRWEKHDFVPRPEDALQERLYCIQWITKASLGKRRQHTFFASVTDEDLARERQVEAVVRENLARWQEEGLVPDMPIEPGEKTDEPIRTRGWTYWHHLFGARQLLMLSLSRRGISAFGALILANDLNFNAKLCGIHSRSANSGRDTCIDRVFINQALNTLLNYGVRSFEYAADNSTNIPSLTLPDTRREVVPRNANMHGVSCELFVTDPPYADAVNYHEITEFFIAWLRKNAPPPFDQWTWDSQRSKAIKGSDEKFRADMVDAYKAIATHMPDNGLQVVMFTHQDAGVWADLAAIMWSAGLRVTAAWNIVTETESALKEGNYVQGTILLVLRKRLAAKNAKRMDIEGEIESEVDRQLKVLHDLDEDWTAERLYTDGDLQLAAYAAALRVITGYETIDRVEVGADVYRKFKKGEKTVIRELIEYAASVANNKLVPEGFQTGLWRELDPASRFYVRMLDMESKGTTRFADFQDFAKTFAVADHKALMGSTKANAASLAGADEMKARLLEGKGFPTSPLRRVLFAIYKTMQKEDPKYGMSYLRTEYGPDYWPTRTKLVEFARYVALKTVKTRPAEYAAADLLAQKLEVDRL